MKIKTGNALIISAVLCGSLLGLSGTAAAHRSVDFNLSIGVPAAFYGPVYSPMYAPPPAVVPVYYPPQVYYPPAYYYSGGPREIWRQREWRLREWREEHRRHERHWRR